MTREGAEEVDDDDDDVLLEGVVVEVGVVELGVVAGELAATVTLSCIPCEQCPATPQMK